MFIRAKKVSGKEYAYLVKNAWTKKGPRQKVAGYLGRVFRPQVSEESDFFGYIDITKDELDDYMDEKKPSEVISDLVSWVLFCHGFEEDKDGLLAMEGITVDVRKARVRQNRKKAVLFVNSDYMCDKSLKSLFDFKSSEGEDEVAVAFAKSFISAGIPVPREVFVELFQKVYREGQSYVY